MSIAGFKIETWVCSYPTEQKDLKSWSALADDFQTLLLMNNGSESIFQQFTTCFLRVNAIGIAQGPSSETVEIHEN